jgi:hypothetical protein
MRRTSMVLAGVALFGVAFGCDQQPDQGVSLRKATIQTSVQYAAGGRTPGERWVLRDLEGAAVDAVVEPTCAGGGAGCVAAEIGALGGLSPECARVVWLGDAYVDLKYSLDSGRAEDCSPHVATTWDVGTYADEDCGGQLFRRPGSGIEDEHRYTRRPLYANSAATLYFESSLGAIVPGVMYSQGEGEDQCVAYNTDDDVFVPWIPVPAWALDAFSNPPYTLSWE